MVSRVLRLRLHRRPWAQLTKTQMNLTTGGSLKGDLDIDKDIDIELDIDIDIDVDIDIDSDSKAPELKR